MTVRCSKESRTAPSSSTRVCATRLRAIESGGSGIAFDPSQDPHQLVALAFAEAELVRRQRWLDDLDRRVQGLRDRRAARRVRAR